MANLTRDKFVPYIDANAIKNFLGISAGSGYDWVRVDKSTVFDFAFNPQEETSGFIDSAADTSYVKSYQPNLPQEIILDSDNPLFEIMYQFVFKFPTGANAVVPALLAVPNLATGEPTNAIMWEEHVISPTDLNTVDGKLIWDMKLNGTPKHGTVTYSTTDYKPTFTAGDWVNTAAETQSYSYGTDNE